MKRVFFAVDISDAARNAVSAHIAGLRTEFPAVRAGWVRAENLHITIQFLGETDELQIEKATHAANAAAALIQPFGIRIGEPGSFGERVLYISMTDESGGLKLLHHKLEAELVAEGFKTEKRQFKSHLTIARIRSPKGIKPLLDRHRSAMIEPIDFSVTELILFESTLTPTGAQYRPLVKTPLGVMTI